MSNKLKIKKLDLRNPVHRRRFEKILKEVQKETQPIADKVRESQRITAKDLAVVINAK